MTTENKKSLGKSSYKNSKQKKKIQKQKTNQRKQINAKNRKIKNKIKNLQKEITRINRDEEKDLIDQNILQQKEKLITKITKLEDLTKKIAEKTTSK